MFNKLKNWLIDLLGGYTKYEYLNLKNQLSLENEEKTGLIARYKRADELLVSIVSSFHNFNYFNNNADNSFNSTMRVIIINLRLFTIYVSDERNILQQLSDDELKQLINLIDVELHKAINSFKISKEEAEKFNCFFYQIKEKYKIEHFILKD
jgi:hypothetical protein